MWFYKLPQIILNLCNYYETKIVKSFSHDSIIYQIMNTQHIPGGWDSSTRKKKEENSTFVVVILEMTDKKQWT